MKPITNIDDPRYVKALAHPMRIRILAILEEQAASPVQIAEHLGETIGGVAYHVRLLDKLGLVELVATRQRRGATEHIYRAKDHPRFTDESWASLGPVGKQRMLSAILGQISEYANRSAAAGGFDRADAHFTRTALKLDEEGFAELAALSKEWLAQMQAVEDRSRDRIQRSADHHTLDAGMVLLLFEARPFSAELPSRNGTGRSKPIRRSRRTAGTNSSVR